MKLPWITACVVALVPAAGFATPNETPAALALVSLQAPTANVCPAATQSGGRSGTGGGVGQFSSCNAQASCSPWGHFQYCTGNSSCVAVDRNCSVGEQGHVTCDGVTHWCQSCSFCQNCVNYDTTCFDCCRCDGGPALFCSGYCS